MTQTLGERMKEYEKQSRTHLLRRTPVIIRLDGCHFHSFTRHLSKPYDKDLMLFMQQTMLALCENIQGCCFGYTQSDEITLVLIDYKNINSDAWFDNQIQKICSVASSIATNAFNQALYERLKFYDSTNLQEYKNIWEVKLFKATFEARAFNVPEHEIINNLIWRQQDCTRNSINLLGQQYFSHKELQGVKANDLQNKLLIEKNINWNNEPTTFKRGSCCYKNENGKWLIDKEMPILTQNRDFINNIIKKAKEGEYSYE